MIHTPLDRAQKVRNVSGAIFLKIDLVGSIDRSQNGKNRKISKYGAFLSFSRKTPKNHRKWPKNYPFSPEIATF
jgi:hypothetical protein